MSGVGVAEAIVGVLLIFFVPGYVVTRALFPEWRVRGPGGWRRLVEIGTLSFVLSVVLTVLVGYVLLVSAPGGFQAYWSDPVLEIALAAIAGLAAVAAWARGAFRREPPAAPQPPMPASDEGAWEVTQELDRLEWEARRLRHQLRVGVADAEERAKLEARLDEIQAERREVAHRRELEYAE